MCSSMIPPWVMACSLNGCWRRKIRNKAAPRPCRTRGSDRRQRGCFLWEAAPKRIRQDGKKRTKRPGDAFHVLYGGGEEGLLVHVVDSEHAGIAQAMQFFGFCEGSFNGFPCAGRRCVCRCLSSQTRPPVPMHPAIHGASPAFCWIWPRSISPVWGSPCMFWARSSTPDSLPRLRSRVAMSARALADTGKRF